MTVQLYRYGRKYQVVGGASIEWYSYGIYGAKLPYPRTGTDQLGNSRRSARDGSRCSAADTGRAADGLWRRGSLRACVGRCRVWGHRRWWLVRDAVDRSRSLWSVDLKLSFCRLRLSCGAVE